MIQQMFGIEKLSIKNGEKIKWIFNEKWTEKNSNTQSKKTKKIAPILISI
jgi:hypothetical protein